MADIEHLQPVLPASLLKAARRLMRPFVRMMIQHGLTFPVLADTLRRLYVEIAVTDIMSGPKGRTDSGISLLTGVHRKEIRRLREMPADSLDAPDTVSLVSQVVARWVGTATFTDGAGRPLALPRAKVDAADAEPSFDKLVESITTDIRPRTVLDSLLSHRVVFMDPENRVQLNTDAFIPRPGREEQLYYFARNLHDHVAAAVANIGAGGAPPFLDRSVHYDRLMPAQAKALGEYARTAAMRALRDVNRFAQEMTGTTAESDLQGSRRINFGVYVFDEEERRAALGES